MRFFILLTIIFAALSISPVNAQDEAGGYQSGDPTPVTMSPEALGFPDIYNRQLAYRIKANELRSVIYERQKNFQAPAIEARRQYEENIERLNKERGTPSKN